MELPIQQRAISVKHLAQEARVFSQHLFIQVQLVTHQEVLAVLKKFATQLLGLFLLL
jgi:hypothetical protein